MVNMIIYIPLATGQTISDKVFDSIAMQTLKPDIVKCESEGEINSEHNYTSARIKGEVISRNIGIDAFLETKYPFFLMQCRDVIQLKPDNFQNIIAFLEKNTEYGACVLTPKIHLQEHLSIATICIRREAIKKGFRFANRYGKCLCKEAMEDFKILGFKYDYMTKKILIKKENDL